MGRRRKTDLDLPERMVFKHGAYYWRGYIDGKQRMVKLSSSFAEAVAKWSDYEGKTFEGSTVGHAIDRYIRECLPELASRTQSEYLRYSKQLRKIFGDTPLALVEQRHVAQYLDRRSAKIEANREVAMLSSVYAYAQRWGWVSVNPCYGVRRNTERARSRHITDGELGRLKSASKPQMRLVIELVMLTALRKADILKIRLSDLTDEGLRVRIQKSRDSTVLLFRWSPKLKAVCEQAKRLPRRIGSFYLFANRKGQPYTTSGFDSNWQRIRKRAKVGDVHFHDLRARALTDAKRFGGRDYAQALAAHRDGSTTERYIRDRDLQIVDPID